MKSLPILINSLLHDCRRLLPGVTGLDRDRVTLLARYENEGIGFLTVALPALGKAFDQGLDSGRFTCPPGFSRKGTIPKLFSGMFCEVFDTKTGLLKESPSLEYIKCIRELLFFFKKFNPSDERREILEARAFADFAKLDDSIRGVAPFRLDRLAYIGSLVLQNLDDFQELVCRHGPGAVAEGVSSNQKWKLLANRLLDFDDSLNLAGYDVVSSLHVDDLTDESFGDVPRSDKCRIVAVPKTSTALRTITVEPCVNQFVQQGYNEHLRRSIERCPVLRRCLTLNDQSKNQELALAGSKSRTWVTMDLSSASDLLSREVVSAVFASKPRFLSGIRSCRTPVVHVNNVDLVLKKYAGMGNATTFPVQSVCFAVIALAAITSGSKRVTLRELRAYASSIRVYGDDIIIKHEYYPSVAEWISSCGLRINRAKTFSKGFFRESCGVDAYKGVNVTPVYLRHDPDLASTDPSALAALVSTANQLWLAGRYSAAKCLEKILGKKLPLIPQDSGGLGWHTRQNVTTISRWNRDLHRFEYRAMTVCAKRKRDPLSGMPALLKYFHSPRIAEFDPTHLESSVRRFQTKVAMRWLPS